MDCFWVLLCFDRRDGLLLALQDREWLVQGKERSPERLSMATEQLMLIVSAAVP
jgi:hypothetical protein